MEKLVQEKQYKIDVPLFGAAFIDVPLFGAAFAAPNKGTTILY